MPDRILNYIEFRYTNGNKQILEGEEADNWIRFTKEKLGIAYKVDKTYVRTWNWKRFDKDGNKINKDGNIIEKVKSEPQPKIKPKSEPKPIPKPIPKEQPNPNYSEYDF